MKSRLVLVALPSLALLAGAACPENGGGDAGPDGGPRASPWQVVLEGLPGALLSVAGSASDDVWLVGADARDGSGPHVLHYDGERIRAHTTGDTGDLWWVSIAPNGDVWMCGDGGRIFRVNPTTKVLTPMRAPDDTRLYGIFAFAEDDVWAVGGTENQGTAVVWRYDGNVWAAPDDLPAGLLDGLVLFKVWGERASDVWMVGQGGAALRYHEGAWSRLDVPLGRPLFTVHGGGGVVVAVGGAITAHVVEVAEGALVDKSPEDAPQLNGVHVSADGSATAVGIEVGIWRRSAGGAWREVEDAPEPEDAYRLSYHAVFEDPAGGVWAVGGYLDTVELRDGVLVHLGAPLPTAITR